MPGRMEVGDAPNSLSFGKTGDKEKVKVQIRWDAKTVVELAKQGALGHAMTRPNAGISSSRM